MSEICLFGAGGHGKVVLDIARSCDVFVKSFIDDAPERSSINEIPVVLTSELGAYKNFSFLICIGNNKIRKRISKELSTAFFTLIHPSVIKSQFVSIEEGTVVMPGSIINSNAVIGKHVILNTSSVVEHDCMIGDFVHISPNATITGGVSIAEGTHVGAGAIVIPGVHIGKWCVIGAGTVVTRDIPDFSTVVGNPGRIIKQKENYE